MKTTTYLTLLLLAICLLAGYACSKTQAPGPRGNLSQTPAGEGDKTQLTYKKSVKRPLQFDLITNIRDTASSITVWDFTFATFDPDVPSSRMTCTFSYRTKPQPYLLSGGDMTGDNGGRSFNYKFPSPQPFLDIVDYMAAYPEIFFDHSEFAGAPEGRYELPEGTQEYFIFGARTGYIDEDIPIASVIVKGITPGQTTAPEVEHVIEQLRILRDELTKHPYVKGEVPE